MEPGHRAEKGDGADEPRIGVFICHCGVNIGGFVDVPAVVEYARTLEGVVHSEHNLYTCAEDGLTAIKDAIREHELNRVIVASCTPRTHEPLFRNACVDAGLNKYLFEMVNIREQCSWVHMDNTEEATDKAMDLIRMAVAKARSLEPLEEGKVDVTSSVLVIGGGVSGMSAALSVADQGFRVFLVEREPEVGGILRGLGTVAPDHRPPGDIIDHLREAILSRSEAEILTSSTISDISGYIGNFEVTLETPDGPREVEIGTIIVAVGSRPMEPEGLYGYGELAGVLTQAELERVWPDSPPSDVVMIQCVGARGGRVSYCSRICCQVAIKNAIRLKRADPDTKVTILHRDIMAYGKENEDMYVKARDLGVRFVRFNKDRPPQVRTRKDRTGDGLEVEVYNESFGRLEVLTADIVVASTPLVPREDFDRISRMLKVPLGQEGFFFEAHVKLRPVDFATDGIFLAGTCRGPCNVPEAIAQGRAAASRATIPLARGEIMADGAIAVVDPAICWGCGECVEVCPYGAPSLVEEGGRRVSRINEVLCKGCGVCVVNCPVTAISAKHFTHGQILDMIEALGRGARAREGVCDPRRAGGDPEEGGDNGARDR